MVMLDSKYFRLRPLTEQDSQTVHNWRNQAHVKAVMFSDNEISADAHDSWMHDILQRSDVDYQIIEYDNKPLGLANAVQIDAASASCHWGFYLGDTQAPKGCGSMLATLMLQHIFDSHTVNTIYGEVFAFNIASLKLHEKFGFERLDDVTKTVDKNGRQENVITLSLNRERWQSMTTQTQI
jgi:UDP-4-amino-4,6-dideoxy-N-acetyl-beta-L-altrosamine N-acetyltransferase